MCQRFRYIALLFLLLLAVPQAFAQLSTVYVDITFGSDTYTGANSTNNPPGTGPKATIHAGLGSVANNGTIVVVAGVYPGDGVDMDGSSGSPTDNADIEISSTKYPNISTGLTIELRSLGTNNEIRIEADANSVLATSGALINHTADDYIPNLVVNLPGGSVKIASTNGTEYLNLVDQHSSGSPTSSIILQAGTLNLPDGSFVRLRSGAAIALYSASGFLDKAPTKGADLNLSYFGDGSITAGPEARYGNYGSGVLTVSKTAGSTVTFPAPISFNGVIVPTGAVVGLVPNKAISVTSGSVVFDNALSLGSVGSANSPPTAADILLSGTASATFNGQVSLVVGAAAAFTDYSISSVENTGSGTVNFNGPVTWSAAWNAAGTALTSLTFGSGSGTALVRNASSGTIRFRSTVALATNSITSQTGDAYFSVVVENAGSGTLSFDQGISAPNTFALLSGNRNFAVHALNTSTGVLNISGTIRGNLSNTGPAGGTVNINGAITVTLKIVNAPGKTIALGSNVLTLARIVGPPFLNDGAGGLVTPSPVNHNTFGGSITATTGTLLLSHRLGIATFNGGTFGSLTCDGIGGTTQLITNGVSIDNLFITGGTLNTLVSTSITNAVDLSSGQLTVADGVTLQTSAFTQSGGTCIVGGSTSGALKIAGDLIRTGGNFSAGTGSVVEIAGSRTQAVNVGAQFQVYDILFNNPGNSITFGQSVRASHSINITSGTSLSLSANDLIVNGDNATVTNAGSILGDGGALVFGGAATVQGGRPTPGTVLNSTGQGLISSLRVDVGVGNRLQSNGAVRVTRVLDLTSGALEIVTGDVSPSGSAARIVHNVVTSPDISTPGGTFNGTNSAYDLEYIGTLNSTITPGLDLNTNVRSWAVNVNCDPNFDGDNDITTGTRYYVQVPGTADFTFGGVLTIGPVAAVRIVPGPAKVSFILSASNVTHIVRGMFTTADPEDNLVISGSGVTILGSTVSSEAALLGNIVIGSGSTCTFRNIQGFTGNLAANAASVVTLGMGSSTTSPGKLASEQIIAGSLVLNGSSFTLGNTIEVRSGLAFNAGTLNFDVYNLTLTTNGDFVQSPNAAGYSSSGGYLVMNRANASLTIGNLASNALPNLRILANVNLVGPGRINGNLEIGTPASPGIPTVRLGAAGNDLTVAGSAITFSSDGNGNNAAIVADGTSNGTVGGKLVIVSQSCAIISNGDFTIEELTYNPVGGTGTLNLVSTTNSPRVFTIGDIFTHVAGDLNLESNHLVLLGTGTGSGVSAYNRTTGSILASTGELRFEGAAAQQCAVGTNFTIPNLKINNSNGVSTFPTTQSFAVSGRLDLSNGAFVVSPGMLVLAETATIIRRQSGSFISSVPTFGNSVQLWYLVDQSNGLLTTQNELPGGNTVLKNLRINNPNSLLGSAGVVLSRNVAVHDTLFLEAGVLVKGSYDMTIASGGAIDISGGTFDSAGSRGGAPLVTTYNLVYRTGTTIVCTNREFQSGSGIRIARLSVLSGQAGNTTTLVLHASRTIGDVTINSDGGGIALGPPASLATRTLTITGNVNIAAGSFLSATGIASLIDLAGSVQQTVTVPASGLVLPGGISSINLRLNNPNGFLLQGGNLALAQGAVLFFVNGVLRTGPNSLVLSQTSGGQGFDRSAVVRPYLSHVQGNVRHSVVGGAGSPTVYPNGRYEFPVGTATEYRPFAFVFGTSYPAINATTVDVEHQEGNPGGTVGLPLDGGSGVRVGNYPAFSWVVTAGAAGFASNQRYDIEVQTPDLTDQALKALDLRIIRRQEAGGASNVWTLQGSGSSYYGNDQVVSSSGDTMFVVRSAFSSGVVNGQGARFAVGVPTRPPVFFQVLRDTSIAEGQNLTFSYIAHPMDLGETIKYSLINPPPGATIDQSTGAFVWKPTFGQAGSYSIVASAFDGQFLTIATATVTVRRVNRPPVFTNVLRDTTIRDTRDTLRFTYIAVDPEADALLFSLISGPPGLTLSNSGVLRWVPTAQQANRSYVVKVMVSDGISRDSTSATVAVTRNRVRGDVDGDGLITANDASLVLRHVVGLIVLADPAALYAADASADGTITAYDASLILQAAAGLIVIPSFSRRDFSAVNESRLIPSAQAVLASLSWAAIAGSKGSSELRVALQVTSQKADIYALQWHIQGDFVRCPVKGITPSLPEGWQLLYNLTDRELNIAAMGPTPISGRELATLALQPRSDEDRITLNGKGLINETAQSLGPLELSAVPAEFALKQNYPNPFNPSTTIKYQIPEKCHVSLVIYNMQGQRIRTLLDTESDPGSFSVNWDGRNDLGDLVSSGSYIYRLHSGAFMSTQRMVLIR